MWYTKILSRAINVLLSIVELFLSLRLILKMFGANPGAPFVAWIYNSTAPLLHPFQGMFASPSLVEGFVIEFSTMFAMIAYALLAWVLVELLAFLSSLQNKRVDKDKDDVVGDE